MIVSKISFCSGLFKSWLHGNEPPLKPSFLSKSSRATWSFIWHERYASLFFLGGKINIYRESITTKKISNNYGSKILRMIFWDWMILKGWILFIGWMFWLCWMLFYSLNIFQVLNVFHIVNVFYRVNGFYMLNGFFKVERFLSVFAVQCFLERGVVVITNAQLHPARLEIKFCVGSNPAHEVSGIHDGEDLWQWSWLERRLNDFRRSTTTITTIKTTTTTTKQFISPKFHMHFC